MSKVVRISWRAFSTLRQIKKERKLPSIDAALRSLLQELEIAPFTKNENGSNDEQISQEQEEGWGD